YVVGIKDLDQAHLGDIVFVESPADGDSVAKVDSIGSLESVKTVSDFYAPVTGKVVAVNETLEDEPELINSNTYNTGWISKLEEVEAADEKAILSSEDYEKEID
ncbi:glycine cleavage system protein H, partial [Listeria monocytogenes]|uniref:glycine cleavage system protein H n=1 Tax=Listeria monocytogenes TaxID=1639 RepID=UPI000E6C33E1